MNLEANPASGIKKQVYDVINHMNMMYRKKIYVEREGGRESATQDQNTCEGLFRKRKGKIKMKIGRKHILLRKKEIETK